VLIGRAAIRRLSRFLATCALDFVIRYADGDLGNASIRTGSVRFRVEYGTL